MSLRAKRKRPSKTTYAIVDKDNVQVSMTTTSTPDADDKMPSPPTEKRPKFDIPSMEDDDDAASTPVISAADDDDTQPILTDVPDICDVEASVVEVNEPESTTDTVAAAAGSNNAPSSGLLEDAYGIAALSRCFMQVDPTTARWKLDAARDKPRLLELQKQLTRAMDELADNGSVAGEEKVEKIREGILKLRPQVVFTDHDGNETHYVYSAIGTLMFDTSLNRGNLVPNGESADRKAQTNDPTAARISVSLTYNRDHPFIEWVKKAHDTLFDQIVNQSNPDCVHMYKAVWDSTVSDAKQFGGDNVSMDAVRASFRKKVERDFSNVFNSNDKYPDQISTSFNQKIGAKTSEKSEGFKEKYTKKDADGNYVFDTATAQEFHERDACYFGNKVSFAVHQPAGPDGKPIYAKVPLTREREAEREIPGNTQGYCHFMMKWSPAGPQASNPYRISHSIAAFASTGDANLNSRFNSTLPARQSAEVDTFAGM